MAGGRTFSSHDVDPDQYEPGLGDSLQARSHEQVFLLGATALDVWYGLSQSWSIGITIPVRATAIDADFRDSLDNKIIGYESIHHRNEILSGIEDISFGVRWASTSLGPDNNIIFSMGAGISIPTGGIDQDPFEQGRKGKTHQHIFYGSGTWDPNLSYKLLLFKQQWGIAQWSDISSSLYKNKFHYRGGTKVSTGFALYSGLGSKTWKFIVLPDFYYESPAQWNDNAAKNTGQSVINIGLGTYWQASDNLTFNTLVQWPFHLHRKGDQLNIPFNASIGLSYVMSLKDI